MNLEARKLNLINWILSIQEEEVLSKMEKIQHERNDWWDSISQDDKEAIEEGIEQLDRGESISRTQARERIKNRYSL